SDGPAHEYEKGDEAGNAEENGYTTAACVLFHAGVQQHDDEDEEHHHRAGIDDDLHSRHEFRAEQQEQQRQCAHYDNQRQRAVNRMALQQEVQSSRDTDHTEDDKQHLVKHKL